MPDFAGMFRQGDLHDGRSQLADMTVELSEAAAMVIDTLPVDQRSAFQAAVSACKTFDDLPPALQDQIRPFLKSAPA